MSHATKISQKVDLNLYEDLIAEVSLLPKIDEFNQMETFLKTNIQTFVNKMNHFKLEFEI